MTLHLRDVECSACRALMAESDAFRSCGQHGTFEAMPSGAVRIEDGGVVSVEVVD